MKSTAIRANQKKTHTITFKNKEHKKFYQEYLSRCRYQDVYHKALVYCLGIDNDTRNHVEQIYDFQSGCVKPECLQAEWQTSGSLKVIRLAFNLYCNGTPSIYNFEDSDLDGRQRELGYYTVRELFCCGYARYFWEAVKIRYPEQCAYDDQEDSYVEN